MAISEMRDLESQTWDTLKGVPYVESQTWDTLKGVPYVSDVNDHVSGVKDRQGHFGEVYCMVQTKRGSHCVFNAVHRRERNRHADVQPARSAECADVGDVRRAQPCVRARGPRP